MNCPSNIFAPGIFLTSSVNAGRNPANASKFLFKKTSNELPTPSTCINSALCIFRSSHNPYAVLLATAILFPAISNSDIFCNF